MSEDKKINKDSLQENIKEYDEVTVGENQSQDDICLKEIKNIEELKNDLKGTATAIDMTYGSKKTKSRKKIFKIKKKFKKKWNQIKMKNVAFITKIEKSINPTSSQTKENNIINQKKNIIEGNDIPYYKKINNNYRDYSSICLLRKKRKINSKYSLGKKKNNNKNISKNKDLIINKSEKENYIIITESDIFQKNVEKNQSNNSVKSSSHSIVLIRKSNSNNKITKKIHKPPLNLKEQEFHNFEILENDIGNDEESQEVNFKVVSLIIEDNFSLKDKDSFRKKKISK